MSSWCADERISAARFRGNVTHDACAAVASGVSRTALQAAPWHAPRAPLIPAQAGHSMIAKKFRAYIELTFYS
jgi:hypothetical protein